MKSPYKMVTLPVLGAVLLMLAAACSTPESRAAVVSQAATPEIEKPSTATPDPNFTPSTLALRPQPVPTATSEERAEAGDTRLYLTAFQNDFVSVVDPVSGHGLHQVPVAAGQAGMAVSPDGKRLYVVDGMPAKDGQLRLFDTSTWETIHREPVVDRARLLGGNPVTLSPDGRWLVVAHYSYERGEAWVSVFDTQDLRFLPGDAWKLADCVRAPVTLIGNPGSARIFVNCGDFVAAMDAETLSPLWRAPSPDSPHPAHALAPHGERLYGLYPHVEGEFRSDGYYHVTQHDLRLLVWEAEKGTMLEQLWMSDLVAVPLPTPSPRPGGYLAISTDGDSLYVVWEDMLWALDTHSLRVENELRLPASVEGIAQSMDGRELYLLPSMMGDLRAQGTGMWVVDVETLTLARHVSDWPDLRIPFFFGAPSPGG